MDCAIRSDSAANIIALRDGPDGVFGSGDDDPFGSVAEIDSVVMVGLWTIDRLYACADARGYLDVGVVPEPEPDPDPEGGIQLWIIFELDAEYNVISGNVYI